MNKNTPKLTLVPSQSKMVEQYFTYITKYLNDISYLLSSEEKTVIASDIELCKEINYNYIINIIFHDLYTFANIVYKKNKVPSKIKNHLIMILFVQ